MDAIISLKSGNPTMFWFGVLNLLAVVVLVTFSVIKPTEFGGTNAWYKPIKFAASTAILCLSLALFTGYLPQGNDITIVNWALVITLAFEVIYITWKAAQGQASHFNTSTPFYATMYTLMALAASAATIAVGFIGIKFFTSSFPHLPEAYLWAIRFGFILFVIFSFEGFAMGGRMAHGVGGADGGKGIPFLNWSVTHGDLRIAHFIGMHALQVLPLLAWFLLKDLKWVIVAFILYAFVAVFVLVQALKGKALIKLQSIKKTQIHETIK
ncbi:MAG: hypothetical protein ACFHU9_05025 [Fluviicola sp.]